MFTRLFIWATFERSIKTFAQALGALLVADGTGILDSNWTELLSVSGMAALLSLLASIASSQVGPGDGPSWGVEHLGGARRRTERL